MKALDPNSINAAESDYLYVQASQISNSGKGLFTSIPIYKDEIIAIYFGKKLSSKEAQLKEKIGNSNYFINMPNGSTLDAELVDGFAKYANDAVGFTKSGYTNNAKIAFNSEGVVCLIATKKIANGAEIFCSYGKAYWKKRR